MKKSILGIWFAVMGLSGFAQNGASPVMNVHADMPQVITNNDIRQLANQLQLNEGQYIRLRDLSKARQEQITEINSMYSNDPAMRQAKIKDAQKEFDTQLAQSVTEKQFTAYLQLQGRVPAASGSSYQAGGYGGRSVESINSTSEAPQQTPVSQDENVNSDLNKNLNNTKNTNRKQNQVRVNQEAVKIKTAEGEMKIKANKEKAETGDMEYKADRDETKFKSKDGTIKAKSERGKTKLETPEGKMKMKDGEVKVKPKRGSQP